MSRGPWIRGVGVLLATSALVAYASDYIPTGQVQEGAPLADFAGHLERRIPSLMDHHDIPGLALALVRDGETVWTGAWGFADRATGRPMTVDTYGRTESISKSVTAWGVMTLVEAGRLALDAPVERHLTSWSIPETEFAEAEITTRLLLVNAAGMPLGTVGVRYDPGGEIPALREHMTGEAVLQRAPGSTFSYSNAGYNVLEILVEDVTGRPFAEYMAEAVLDPLGMARSSYTWSAGFHPPVATGYDVAGQPIPPYVYPDRASGGLFSTVGDIATFVAAGMTSFNDRAEGVLEPGGIETIYSPVVQVPGFYGLVFEAYGMGHYIETLPTGDRAVSHGGQGSGWMTQFYSVPATGDGIVIFTNSQRAWPAFAYLLADWADWIGAGSVGMERIVGATRGLWVLMGAVLFAALWQASGLLAGLLAGRRRIAPLAPERRGVRTAAVVVALALAAAVVWTATRPYSVIPAVFPVAAPWLAGVLILSAAVLILSAAAPRRSTG